MRGDLRERREGGDPEAVRDRREGDEAKRIALFAAALGLAACAGPTTPVRTDDTRPAIAVVGAPSGGVLVVQYNLQDFDQNYGPYPFSLGNNPQKVVDESSTVRLLNAVEAHEQRISDPE